MEFKEQTILIVDDNNVNRSLLKDMLKNDYNIIEAENGVEAIATLNHFRNKISLVLLDIVMPEIDGFDVLATMNQREWIKDIPVIMVTSETSPSAIERAYLLGVTDFISRPFDYFIVYHRVKNTLVLHEKQKSLTNIVVSQVKEKERSTSLMVNILSQIVEFRNGESGLHVLHVNTLTDMLLKHMVKTGIIELTLEQIKNITLASSLHDVGKIGIPEEILNKPGKLTDEEFNIMKNHSIFGAEMLSKLPNYENEPLLKTSYEICRWHHERWDGKGYPDGLIGDQIPLSAQVVSLADVYDALTSVRVYKDAFPHKKALEMISNGECGQFNPQLIKALNEIESNVEKELKLNSFSTYNLKNIHDTTSEIIQGDLIGPSSNTLKLIDYERVKYDFYASINKEIQFEITFEPTILAVLNYSDFELGLNEIISNPKEDKDLKEILGEDELNNISQLILNTKPDNSIFECDLDLHINGELRWFHLYGKVIWEETSNSTNITGVVGKLIDIHDNVIKFAELENKATHDSLTNLTNHDFAKKLINEKNTVEDRQFILMIIDIDNFKDVNDSFGHLYGDKVIKTLADTIKKATREGDITARIGGDEFMIFLDYQAADPKNIVNRIYSMIEKAMDKLNVSVSIGASYLKSPFKYDDLFVFTDNILYEMKNNKKGCILKSYVGDENE